MNKKWISRTEAAEILGVCPQTISNYAEKGLIHMRPIKRTARTGYYAFSREEVEALRTAPIQLHTIEEMERAIAEEYQYTAQRYNEAKREFKTIFGGHHNWDEYKRIIKAVVAIAEDGVLTELTKDIIDKLLDGMPIKEIAEHYSISTLRVHQIIFRGIRKIAKFPERYAERTEQMEAELDGLRKENSNLKARLLSANHIEEMSNDNGDEYYHFRYCWPFSIRLEELGLSIRAWNCCRVFKIDTLGDLCSYKRIQIMKFRNLGRKTLSELETALEKYNLHWGMWHDPLRHEKDSMYD